MPVYKQNLTQIKKNVVKKISDTKLTFLISNFTNKQYKCSSLANLVCNLSQMKNHRPTFRLNVKKKILFKLNNSFDCLHLILLYMLVSQLRFRPKPKSTAHQCNRYAIVPQQFKRTQV